MERSFKSIFFIPFISLIIAFSVIIHAKDSKASESGAKEIIENIIALNEKLICSGIFVVGREKDEFIKNDMKLFLGVSRDDIEVTVDQKRKAVTLTVEGITPRIAVYNGDQGCTLLPRGIDILVGQVEILGIGILNTRRVAWLQRQPLKEPLESGKGGMKGALLSFLPDLCPFCSERYFLKEMACSK